MVLTHEFKIGINLIFLFIAVAIVLVVMWRSALYRRNVGDTPEQNRQKKTILRLIVLLLILSITAATFNLVS
jgi:Mg2+ and Co2+ transporter CorA